MTSYSGSLPVPSCQMSISRRQQDSTYHWLPCSKHTKPERLRSPRVPVPYCPHRLLGMPALSLGPVTFRARERFVGCASELNALPAATRAERRTARGDAIAGRFRLERWCANSSMLGLLCNGIDDGASARSRFQQRSSGQSGVQAIAGLALRGIHRASMLVLHMQCTCSLGVNERLVPRPSGLVARLKLRVVLSDDTRGGKCNLVGQLVSQCKALKTSEATAPNELWERMAGTLFSRLAAGSCKPVAVLVGWTTAFVAGLLWYSSERSQRWVLRELLAAWLPGLLLSTTNVVTEVSVRRESNRGLDYCGERLVSCEPNARLRRLVILHHSSPSQRHRRGDDSHGVRQTLLPL